VSDKTEWFHGVLETEFWTVHRGWRVFIRKSQFGWHWSIMREGASRGCVTDDRAAAEAAAFAAVDRMVGNE
jgi:hypothetical protein